MVRWDTVGRWYPHQGHDGKSHLLVSVITTDLETVKEAVRIGMDRTRWTTSQKSMYS